MQPNVPVPTNSQQERSASEADLLQVDVNKYLSLKAELEAVGAYEDPGSLNFKETEVKVERAKELYYDSGFLNVKDCFACLQQEQESQFD